MTTQDYKKQYLELEKEFSLDDDFIMKALRDTMEKINFLENIYLTGGKNGGFSENFKNQAYAERAEMSKKANAQGSILSDRKEAEKC